MSSSKAILKMNKNQKKRRNEGSKVKVKMLTPLVERMQRPLVVKRVMMASRNRLKSNDHGNTSSRMVAPTSSTIPTTLKTFKGNQT